MSYEFYMYQFFEVLIATDLRSEKVATFSAQAPPPEMGYSSISVVLSGKGKYHAKQRFISAPLTPPPPPSTNKYEITSSLQLLYRVFHLDSTSFIPQV